MIPQEKDDRDERENREEKESEMSRAATREPEHLRRSRRQSVVWWLFFLQAIAALLLGVLLLALLLLPTASAVDVLALIGAYWLISGLFAIVSGFFGRAEARWAWSLGVGVLSMLAGILAPGYLSSTSSVIILTLLALVMGGLDIVRHRHAGYIRALGFGLLDVWIGLDLLLIPLN